MEGLTLNTSLLGSCSTVVLQYSQRHGPNGIRNHVQEQGVKPHSSRHACLPAQQPSRAVRDLHTGGFQVPLKYLAHFTDGLSLLLLPADIHQLEGSAASAPRCPAP